MAATARPRSPGSPRTPCSPGSMAATMAAQEDNALIAAPATSHDAASRQRIAALRSSQLAAPPVVAAAASPGSPYTPGRVTSLMAAREGNALVAAPATSPDAASRRRIAALRSKFDDGFSGAGGAAGCVGTPRPGGPRADTKAGGTAAVG